MPRSFSSWLARVGLLLASGLSLAGAPPSLELLGVTVTPHVPAERLRYREARPPGNGARVELFVRARADVTLGPASFDGRSPAQLLSAKAWAWHDTPDIWPANALHAPADTLMVWRFNAMDWTPGQTVRIAMPVAGAAAGAVTGEFAAPLTQPAAWLSAITFLGPTNRVAPEEMLAYVANESGVAQRPIAGRLWLPADNASFRFFRPQANFARIETLPVHGWIPSGEKGLVRIATGPLPLTYAVVELRLVDVAGAERTLWAHLRVKRESFDISGGWVGGDVNGRNPLTFEPFLKTLRWMHVNTAHLQETPGYTDSNGPDGLYTRYPLKYFNRLEPVAHYDSPEVLPRIHAVEFLGEPQYGGGRPVPPQTVFDQLAPYAPTHLPTTVTHSEERLWRAYAGLSDYPHYDAYRVSAPSPDAWRKYDRWGDRKIGWGAPLETIGDMCRSLRELYRPVPTAYWSQGPHSGWEVYDGRKRTSPTPDELRLQAYHALASRITSLYWFNLSLKSLVKWPDTLDELRRVGREIRLLDSFYLTGDAYRHRETSRDGRPDWGLASIVSPAGALLFALDLDYVADPTNKVFTFGPPREATFTFALPAWLWPPEEVFRVDADGVADAVWLATGQGIQITDRQSKVAIYVAARDKSLRPALARRHRELVAQEESLGFDPVRNPADGECLKKYLETR